jgi:TPR repeat protein
MLGLDMPDSPGSVLYLELRAENFGGVGKIRFEIPVSSIKNWSGSKTRYMDGGRKQKDRDAERRSALEGQSETQKAGAEKKAAQEKVLKWHLEQAEKGDSFGLFRMGEHYRDGDGVPKDLSKAREYFTKAANAGSPSAKDALARLDQAPTNTPASK